MTSIPTTIFDSNIWYRLTSVSQGANFSLDTDNDGHPRGYATVSLQPTGVWSGQIWQISNTSNGLYQFCAQFLGPNYRLGHWVDDQSNNYPGLFTGTARNSPAQQWRIQQDRSSGDLEFDIINNELGSNLDVGGGGTLGSYGVILRGSTSSDRHRWRITADGEINDKAYSSISPSASAIGSGSTTAPRSSASSSITPDAPVSSGPRTSPVTFFVGLIIGVLALCVVLGVCWIWWSKRRKRRKAGLQGGQQSQSEAAAHGGLGAIPTSYYEKAPAGVEGRRSGIYHEISGTPVAEVEGRSVPRLSRAPLGQDDAIGPVEAG